MAQSFDWSAWSDPIDPDLFVYHYTTRDAAVGSILPTGQIRLGLYRTLNDPRESRGWLFRPAEPDATAWSVPDDLLRISKRANELAKDTTKIFCVSCDTAVASPGQERFSRGYSHSSMWTHYAGRHSGVCLIFDRAALHETIVSALGDKNLFSDRVAYEDWTPELQRGLSIEHRHFGAEGEDRTIRAHLRAYHRELFFHKNRDWSHEVEHRWVFFGSSPTPEFVPFRDALAGICVSESYPDPHDSSLLFLAARYGIDHIPQFYWTDLRVKRKPPGIVPIDYQPSGGFHVDEILVPPGPRLHLDFENLD
jgi:hypothetical protein